MALLASLLLLIHIVAKATFCSGLRQLVDLIHSIEEIEQLLRFDLRLISLMTVSLVGSRMIGTNLAISFSASFTMFESTLNLVVNSLAFAVILSHRAPCSVFSL